jgi:hypothetical protein
MAKINKPSVQSLFIQMQFNGQTLSTGTAFVVNTPTKGPHLITNRHNVTGKHHETGKLLSKMGGIPNEIKIFHNRKSFLGQWVERIESLFMNGNPRWVEHPVLGSKADFIALSLSHLIDVELYPYDLLKSGPEIKVGPADPVSVIGFPFGITAGGFCGVWATGFLASEPDINFNNLPIVLVDCRTRQGQSGSPVLAYRAGGAVAMNNGGSSIFDGPVEKFIGIYSGRINEESDLGIVWKAQAIADLISIL